MEKARVGVPVEFKKRITHPNAKAGSAVHSGDFVRRKKDMKRLIIRTRLYMRFCRSDATQKNMPERSVVQRIIQAHGAAIGASSTADAGNALSIR